jgi:predicted O-linked N-acetylglucosamine transferase (SPINDLY family)
LSARGRHALARIGDWLARAADAPWTACADAGEFAARAAELAADPSRLIDARRTWRDRLREKSRLDAPRAARALEDALIALAERRP